MMSEAAQSGQTPRETAAEWFARKRSGAMSAQELCELQAWLDESAENAEAWRAILAAWDMAARVGTDPEMLTLRESVMAQRPARRRRLWGGAGSAAALVLCAGVFLAYRAELFADFFTPVWERDYHTAVGRTATVALPDGSVVSLDTDTFLHVREGGRERLVRLERGQAFFRVAKDHTRPFVVDANGNTVTATGTRFDVRIDPGAFKVILLEGKVRVETPPNEYGPGERSDLLPGWQFTDSLDDINVTPIGRAAAMRETAWLAGHVSVIATPLRTVVEELNRYTVKKILVTPAIADRAVDGVFRAGDIEGFVNLVRRYRLARVVSDTPDEIVLDAPKKSSRRLE